MGEQNGTHNEHLIGGEARTDSESTKAIAVGSGIELTDEQIRASTDAYEQMRFNDPDSPQTVGLFGEDLERALRDSHTVFITVDREGEQVHLPLFVPTKDVEWYNKQLLEKQFHPTRPSYYFSQIDLPTDFASEQKILAAVRSITDDRGYIIQERLTTQSNKLEAWKEQLASSDARVERIGLGEIPARIDLFVGKAEVAGNDERLVKDAPSFFETYRQAVEAGEIEDGSHEGASVADVIDGEEAERLWGIYKNPFAELGEAHALEAGFSHEAFLAILADPNIAKVVHRADGEITTLMLFVTDLDYYPWFNKQYFDRQYPGALETENVLVFPGIVSDETKRGMNYSYPVVQLAADVVAKRGSDLLIAFECNEISAQYIPSIVKAAVELGDSAKLNNLEHPVSQMVFEALSA